MKAPLVILAALAGLAFAAEPEFAQFPECARPCLSSAYKTIGCGVHDTPCGCKAENQKKIRDHATKCVIDACGISKALKTKSIGEKACKDFKN
ncbi:uncharacterized protein UV8b_00066 [Ustilaginoidea virens]|uniref:CFEM domain-containing protein n=1 Tax=Ustilaginoidea virens TaxID=1159556 RepID=A0A8E5HIC7_USTVR|nr:uncharacterized protein UV8b_00066 [Ustilaginoidea virens]QUC15825.1 hypothetical protein UV8b_00066 [Ustilaginoidea virens]